MEAFDNETVQLIIRCKYERSNSIEISFTQVWIKDFMYNHYQRTFMYNHYQRAFMYNHYNEH